MTDHIDSFEYNLIAFMGNHWRAVYMSSLIENYPNVHEHVAVGAILTEIYRQACEDVKSATGAKQDYYEGQFTHGLPNSSAEGHKVIYDLAVDKLDVVLMTTPAYKAAPTRLFGLRRSPEGDIVTPLLRPLPHKSPLRTSGTLPKPC